MRKSQKKNYQSSNIEEEKFSVKNFHSAFSMWNEFDLHIYIKKETNLQLKKRVQT